MSAPPRGGGHCFGCGSSLRRCWRWRQRSMFEELHLRNLLVDSDQICMVTLPGWRKTVCRFWWPWPHLQWHSPQTVNFGPKMACLQPIDEIWSNLVQYIIATYQDLIRFWWPWPQFLGHSLNHPVPELSLTDTAPFNVSGCFTPCIFHRIFRTFSKQ